MRTSNTGVDLIKHYEGFEARPYLCPARVWTVGYGSTFGSDGRRVTKDHPDIDRKEAEKLLRRDLRRFEGAVARLVKVPLTQGQFDALVSFAYNLGSGALSSSTLRRKLNRGDYAGAAQEFKRWVYAGGVKLKGLLKRRAAEADLFINGTGEDVAT